MSEIEHAHGALGAPKTPEERRAALAFTVANEAAKGWRVESQTDYQAIMAKGKPTSHGLHLFLSIITLGLWLPVWAVIWYLNRRKTQIVRVDEYGGTSVSEV